MNHRASRRPPGGPLALIVCPSASIRVVALVGALIATAGGRAEDCNGNGVEDAVDLGTLAVGISVAERHEVGLTPRNVVAVDINSDGALDLVSPNRHSNTLSLLLSRGDGRLGAPEFVAASNPAWITSADFNGDGAPDIASVSTLATRLELFRGAPNLPSFSLTTVALDRSGWDRVESGDVDGDAAPDLVLSNRFDRLVAVLFNSNDGTFAFEAPVTVELPADVVPRAFALLDIEGDGDLDIAVASEVAISGTPPMLGRLSLLVNRGERAFGALLTVPNAGQNPHWVAALDYDGDGDDDLAWTDLGDAAAADGALRLGENDGSGAFTPRVIAEGDLGFLLSGDFDGDAKPDLAALTSDGRVSVFRNEGGFVAAPSYVPSALGNVARAAVAADLDGDGVDEIASANWADDQSRNELSVLRATLVPAYFDADSDGVLDVCQEDCNRNGVLDSVDLARGDATDCDGSGVPDSCELEANDENRNGVFDPCEASSMRFDIEGPDSLRAVAGRTVEAEYVATLLATPEGDDARYRPQGWSLSLVATGARIVSSSHDRTAADDEPFGLHRAGFRLTELASDGEREGIVSAVVLSAIRPSTFPLRETVPILRVTVETDLPGVGLERRAALVFEDGLPGPVQPVENRVTADGESLRAFTGRKEITIARRSDLYVGAEKQFATVQAAIDAASPGDHVVVTRGEYVSDVPIDFKGKAITVRSLDGAAATVLRMSDTPASPERASVVVFTSGETRESMLEGFTLTGGRGSMHRYASWVLFDSPVGGGIFCLDSSPTVRDCVITRNRSMDRVDGAHSPDTQGGAAVTCLGDSRALFERCLIAKNRGGHAGGVLGVDASITLRHSTIVGNSGYHAGVFFVSLAGGESAHPTITGCLIAGNAREGVRTIHAGFSLGLDLRTPSWTVSYCTIADNAGGDLQTNTVGRMVNTIAWSSFGMHSNITRANVMHSDVLDGAVLSGEGNLNVDPLFIRPGVYDFLRFDGEFPDFVVEGGDYGLANGSPAIDAGAITGIFTTDLAGRPRRCGSGPSRIPAPDMGAYEHKCFGPFRRGDSNADGSVNISDSLFTLSYLFLGGPPVLCLDAGDVDDSGVLDISDVVAANGFLFLGGPAPEAPGPFACGADPTTDTLDCSIHPPCP